MSGHNEGSGDDSRRLLGLNGPGRDLSDDALIDLIREAYAVMEPVPQRVYDQAYAAFGAAHELRHGDVPVVVVPGQTPGEAAVPDSTALPGHHELAPAFFRRVQVSGPGDCWPWTGEITYKGYGRHTRWTARYVRTRYAAHRLAYELLVGPIPDGLVLDHLCRNRSCCNPAHLEPVTERENTLRGTSPAARNARVTHCPEGHAYDEANTCWTRANRRVCRACNNRTSSVRRKRRLARLRAAKGGAE